MKPTLLIAESDAGLRDAYRRFFTGRGYGGADALAAPHAYRRTLDHLLSSAIPWPSTFFSLRPVLPNHLQTVALPHCCALGTAFAFSATR